MKLKFKVLTVRPDSCKAQGPLCFCAELEDAFEVVYQLLFSPLGGNIGIAGTADGPENFLMLIERGEHGGIDNLKINDVAIPTWWLRSVEEFSQQMQITFVQTPAAMIV